MFRETRGNLLAIALLVVLAAIASACGSSNSMPTMNTGTSGTGTTGGTSTAADVTITIVGMNGANSFSPNPGAVAVGQTVAWKNADGVAHTATGSGFDTGVIQPGATSAPIRFDAGGSIAYRCTIHPTMTGTLNVGGATTAVPY